MRRIAFRVAIACALLTILLGAAWFVASSMGRDFLRHELERQLSDLMNGEVRIPEIRFELHSGLAVRGYDVSVYPASAGPGLFGREVYAELSETAALLGSFQLAVLSIEDLEVRLQRDPSGMWQFPPLRALQGLPGATQDEDPGSRLLLITALDAVTRALMRDRSIADLVSIQRGIVRFEDLKTAHHEPSGAQPEPTAKTTQPLSVALEDLRADLSRPWHSGQSELRLIATLIDPKKQSTPIVIRGRGARGRSRSISLELKRLDLDVLDRYTELLGADFDLDGFVSGLVSFEATGDSDDPRNASLEAALELDGVVSKMSTSDSRIEVPLPVHRVDVRLEVSPDYLRIARAEATGDEIGIGVNAIIARPLAGRSHAEISTELRGAKVEIIEPILEQLPPETRESIGVWFDSIEAGRMDHLGIRGAAPLATWHDLATGELQSLPEGFELGFSVSNVIARLDDGAAIENLSFDATMTDEELMVSDARGDWKGEPLPTTDVTIIGLSRFLDITDSPAAPPTPPVGGASYLWELVSSAGTQQASDTERRDPRRLEVDLDTLLHPLLGWPLERAHVIVDPTIDGTRARLEYGLWGGVPIRGEAIYEERPEPRLSFSLEAEPRDPTQPPRLLGKRERSDEATDSAWASGRFVLEPVEYDPTPAAGVLSMLSGEFALRQSRLELADVRLAIGPEATAQVELILELETRDEVGLSLDAHIVDVRLEGIIDAFDLPEGLATGTTKLKVKLGGTLRRSDKAYQGIEGVAEFKIKDGNIRQKIPMIVALAAASDGFNPLASKDSMHYDKIVGNVRIQDGHALVDRFELEGPIRVYATGSLEFGRAPYELNGVVGVFLFQRTRELLGMVPLVNLVVPGSDKGMFGAYFALGGSWEEPDVSTMKLKSIHEQLPDIFTKPFQLFHSLMAPEDEPSSSPQQLQLEMTDDAENP